MVKFESKWASDTWPTCKFVSTNEMKWLNLYIRMKRNFVLLYLQMK